MREIEILISLVKDIGLLVENGEKLIIIRQIDLYVVTEISEIVTGALFVCVLRKENVKQIKVTVKILSDNISDMSVDNFNRLHQLKL